MKYNPQYPDLVNFMNSRNLYQVAVCYIITLPNLITSGEKTFYWTSCDRDIQYIDPDGNLLTFTHPVDNGALPLLVHGDYSSTLGLETTTMELILYCGTTGRIPGVDTPIPQLARRRAFDGATVLMSHVIMDESGWGLANVKGVIPMFSGMVSQVSPSSAGVTLTVSSLVEKIRAMKVPLHSYEPQCQNVLADHTCGIDPATLVSSFAVTAPYNASPKSKFYINSSDIEGRFNMGVVRFTSGLNNGAVATCRVYTHLGVLNGLVELVTPLQYAPQTSDTLTITRGCNKSYAQCKTDFNNLHHFRGFPYVPSPESVI